MKVNVIMIVYVCDYDCESNYIDAIAMAIVFELL